MTRRRAAPIERAIAPLKMVGRHSLGHLVVHGDAKDAPTPEKMVENDQRSPAPEVHTLFAHEIETLGFYLPPLELHFLDLLLGGGS